MSYFLRLSAFYGAIFLVIGTYGPYMPVWLDWRGLSAGEISLVLSLPLFVRLWLTPAIAFLADRRGAHRLVMVVLAWGMLATLLVLGRVHGFWPILFAVLVYSLFQTGLMPLTETIAMAGVRATGLDYGRMRLWGSITFILGSFGGGFVIDRFGPPSALWLVLAGSIATVAAAHALPRPDSRMAAEEASAARRLSIKDAMALVRSPPFLLMLAATGAAQASHALLYAFGTLHWQRQGFSAGMAGTLWSIGVIAEIALFAWSGAVVARLGVTRLLWLGSAAAAVRWAVMAFDPPLALQLALQLLHALSFGATHLATIHFIGRAVPTSHAGTAQALAAAVTSGIAMGGAMAISGPLYAASAGRAYLAMAAFGVAALVATAWLTRRWDGQPVV